MNLRYKVIIILILLVLIVYISYIIISSEKQKSLKDKNVIIDPDTGKPKIINDIKEDVVIFPLKKGSKNDYVRKLQIHLNLMMPSPIAKLDTDGAFGSLTEFALKSTYGITEISEAKYNSLNLWIIS